MPTHPISHPADAPGRQRRRGIGAGLRSAFDGVARRLPAMTIPRKLALLTSLALTGLAIVFTIYLLVDREMGLASQASAERGERQAVVARFERLVAEMRAVQGFEIGRTQTAKITEAIDRARDAANAELARLNLSQEQMTNDGLSGIADLVDPLRDTLAELADIGEAMGLTADAGAKADLNAAAGTIEMRLAELRAAPLDTPLYAIDNLADALTQMRLSEKTFIAEESEAALTRFGSASARFEAGLRALEDRPRTRDQIGETHTIYASAFDAYSSLVAARGKLDRKANSLSEALGSLIGQARFVLDTQAQAAQAELAETATRTRTVVLWTGCITFLALLLGSVLLAGSISRPLKRIGGAMSQLADGRLQADIPSTDRRDEIGEMAQALLVFRDNAREAMRLRGQEEETAARAAAERRESMMALATELERNVGEVIEAVSVAAETMRGTADRVATSAAQMGQRATGAAGDADTASGNVGTVASAAEELSRSIAEIGERAQESSSAVRAAVDQVGEADGSVRELSDAGARIADVVDLIAQIAEQTNLLALNATIEASRAGDAGRGFTVVASEVKTLAGQTAKATQEIAERIRAMREVTERSAGAIGRIGERVREVDEIALAVAGAVEQQNATTQEIARSIHAAAQGTSAVSSQMTVLDQDMSAMAATTGDVLSSADDLARQADALKGHIATVLRQLRAA